MANPPYEVRGDGADDLGWGPARSVRASGSRTPSASRTSGSRGSRAPGDRSAGGHAFGDDGWSESTRSDAGSAGSRGPAGRTPRAAGPDVRGRGPSATAVQPAWDGPVGATAGAATDDSWSSPASAERTGAPERGFAPWLALVVLLVIAGIGGMIDAISGTQVRGGFNIGIVVASVAAILVVRRSGMFPIVVAPPIVYSLASGVMVYVRTGGLSDHKALYDAAANWLVYGFPAIACATAAVLIIAGARMITHR